jgi:hypothetical protein
MGAVRCVVVRDTAPWHTSMTVVAYLWYNPNVQAKIVQP